MQEVVPQYKQLGNILLKSSDGLRVLCIEKDNHGNIQNTVYCIFQMWLVEDVKATWDTLVQCLKYLNLNTLAAAIDSCLV